MLKMITDVVAVNFSMFNAIFWERQQSYSPSNIILMVLVNVAGSAVLFSTTVMDMSAGGGKYSLYRRMVLVDSCLNSSKRSGCLPFHGYRAGIISVAHDVRSTPNVEIVKQRKISDVNKSDRHEVWPCD
jgi:hypothetical protein